MDYIFKFLFTFIDFYLFLFILIFNTLICIYKLQNVMYYTKMDGRFVLLAMSERALSNDF
jgi:hypothetical protein